MGSCSNRSETKSERIGRYAKKISESRDTSTFEWQTSEGAKIRGELGIEKGNAFIEAIKQAN
ncbi:hypothetical protein LCGC14_2869290, partial [marine sediment metagenome]